ARDRLRLQVLVEDTGLKIAFVKEKFDENAFGRFAYGLRQELAGLEVGLLKERQREGYLGRAKEGWYPRRPMWPWITGDKARGEQPSRLDPARPERANAARRLFEVIVERRCTVDEARKIVAKEGHVYSTKSRVIPRSPAYRLVRDRFAYGEFLWEGVVYQGKH